jgi:hypothetical protein
MQADFRKGYLELNFPVQPFDSVGRLLRDATRLFFANLRFLSVVTLAVLLPGKLLLQLACYLLDVPAEGVISYLVMDSGDLVFSALVAPAAIFGLVTFLRSGKPCPVGEAFRWGRRQWGKTLWNQLKVEVTVTLWSALLIVPGIVAMLKLIFTEPIVAIEGDRETEVLRRSRELSAGRRWRILLALLPALPLGLAHMYATLRALQISRGWMVPVDSLFGILDQWMTTAVLLIYLGVAAPPATAGSTSARASS